jgi:hypothetical protein
MNTMETITCDLCLNIIKEIIKQYNTGLDSVCKIINETFPVTAEIDEPHILDITKGTFIVYNECPDFVLLAGAEYENYEEENNIFSLYVFKAPFVLDSTVLVTLPAEIRDDVIARTRTV